MATDLRVCFLGDSFVAGVGDPEHRGWVGRLCARSTSAGRPLTAYVLGVRRRTSRDVLQRWEGECAPRLPPDCDGRLVLSFGVNDSAFEGDTERVPADESRANLTTLLRQIRAAGWKALVVGPPPVADPTHNERIAALDEAFSGITSAAGIAYAGVYERLLIDPDWMTEVAANDGSHPGAAGYARLADLVGEPWRAWLDL